MAATVRRQAREVPLALRRTCFVTGELARELARRARKGQERFTLLRLPGSYASADAKTRVSLPMYSAVAEATGCQRFVFDWQATRPIGYLLDRP